MFIKINDTNYFVIPDGKSVGDIYNEIFGRMGKTYITSQEKREMLSAIKKQLKKTSEIK